MDSRHIWNIFGIVLIDHIFLLLIFAEPFEKLFHYRLEVLKYIQKSIRITIRPVWNKYRKIYRFSLEQIFKGLLFSCIVNKTCRNYTGANNGAEAAIDSNYLLSYEITDTA